MHELHSNDIAGGHEWAHGEDAAAINTAMDDRGETIGRAIRIGDVTTTGSVLALVRKQGDDLGLVGRVEVLWRTWGAGLTLIGAAVGSFLTLLVK